MLATVALTGLMAGSAARLQAATPSGSDQASSISKGQNTCKGTGGCKTGDAGCKGKNTCKGKGGCKTTPTPPATT